MNKPLPSHIDDSPHPDNDESRAVPTPARVAHVIPPDLIDPDAVKVIRRLTRAGHLAYLVGGCVRDLLLDRSPKDFDVATSARPNQVRDQFRNCRVIGRRFRLAHILFGGGKVIEVATFRRDPGSVDAAEPDDRSDDDDRLIRQDNVFGQPHEDARRRDFTINGLFYDIDRSEVLDYVGGMDDVTQRLVRTIGYPDVRVREDPIRILRAVKFSARLDLGIDGELYDAMVERAGDLSRAAPPRVLEEIFRLLRGGAAQRSIVLAWDVGALSVILPELAAYLDDDATGSPLLWKRLLAVDARQRAGRLPSDAVLFLSLIGGPLREVLDGSKNPSDAFDDFFEPLVRRLSVPRRLRDRIRMIVATERRLAEGKFSNLVRRDFFDDAATALAIELEARGEPLPKWLADREAASAHAR